MIWKIFQVSNLSPNSYAIIYYADHFIHVFDYGFYSLNTFNHFT